MCVANLAHFYIRFRHPGWFNAPERCCGVAAALDRAEQRRNDAGSCAGIAHAAPLAFWSVGDPQSAALLAFADHGRHVQSTGVWCGRTESWTKV